MALFIIIEADFRRSIHPNSKHNAFLLKPVQEGANEKTFLLVSVCTF